MMNYNEKLSTLVQEFYDTTKRESTSRTYRFSYWWVSSNFGLDLHDDEIKSDVREMSYTGKFMDLINTIDIDDTKEEVVVMIWEQGDRAKKVYTLRQYKEFCNAVLAGPPCFDDEGIDGDEWYNEHKIHITVGNHEMVLGYFADNVNELADSLREMYEAEYEDGYPTTGNTVGCGYRSATFKDIVLVAIREGWEHSRNIHDFATYVRDFIKKNNNLGDILGCYKYINQNIQGYNEQYKCDFGKLDMDNMCNVDSAMIKRTICDLICTDRELLYGITEDNKTSDIVFVMDHTLKPSGELIGWFYGQDDIDEEYISDLIEDYKKKLFGEEN